MRGRPFLLTDIGVSLIVMIFQLFSLGKTDDAHKTFLPQSLKM